METKIYQKNRGLLKYPSVKQENGGIFLNVRTIMKSLRAWLESYFQCLKGLLCEPGSLFSSSTSPISEKLIEYDFFLSALKLCSYSAGMSSPVIPGELIKAWWLLGICLRRNNWMKNRNRKVSVPSRWTRGLDSMVPGTHSCFPCQSWACITRM